MDDELDAIVSQASNPNLIPGIYNYCDRRCERCRFTERCLVYVEMGPSTGSGQGPSTSSGQRRDRGAPGGDETSMLDGLRRSFTRTFEIVHIIAERHGIDLSMTGDELKESEQEQEELRRRAEGDSLVRLARHYLETTWPILRALRPIVISRRDPAVIEAVETIDELCVSISAKIYRAVSGSLDADFDATDPQSDANGSAKVARVLVAESCDAWRLLMEVGRAAANGVPAQLVRRLEELEAGLAARFPQAMEFVRPGFDTEPLGPAVSD